MTRVVNVRSRNRREIEVVTLCIGPVHLIQALSNLRDAKDVARFQLKHRAKFIGGKDTIVPEADLASAVLGACVNVECDDELMSAPLVGQLFGGGLNCCLEISVVLKAQESYPFRERTRPLGAFVRLCFKVAGAFSQVHGGKLSVTSEPDIGETASGCRLSDDGSCSQQKQRAEQDIRSHAQNCNAVFGLPSHDWRNHAIALKTLNERNRDVSPFIAVLRQLRT